MNIAVCCKTGMPTAKLDFLNGIALYAKYGAISSLLWTRALMHTGQNGFVRIFQVFLRYKSGRGICNPSRNTRIGTSVYLRQRMAYDDDEAQDEVIKGRNFGVLDYLDNVSLHIILVRRHTHHTPDTPVPLNIVLKVPVFTSVRVDRWSAAARLLIGASPPVSHTHIDSLSSLLVQQPSCTPRPSASLLSSPRPPLFLFLSTLRISSRLLFFFFYLSSRLSFRRYFHPLGLSAAVCLPIISPSPSPFIAPTPSFVFLHVDQ